MNCNKCGQINWAEAVVTSLVHGVTTLAIKCSTVGCKEWYLTKPQLAELIRKINDKDNNETRESTKRPA